ncbi:MAG: fatty acid desaturase [Spirochaetales bacterium]|nr:fatty acid desaturase [Spirochaetales bacterium]
MGTINEPLKEVKKNFKVDWYRCPVPKERLRALTSRSDSRGWLQSLGYLALITATAFATYTFFTERMWVLFAAALFVHGTIYCFNPGLVTHELSHGTVFKTRWLNVFFLRFFSLLGWVNFHHYKRSHTFHHLYTLHPRGDREVVLPGNPSLRVLLLLRLFTFDFKVFWMMVKNTFMLAVFRKFDREWSEAIFPDDDPKSQNLAINWARMILLFHAAVLATAIVFNLWMLPVVITLSNFVATWWRYFIGITMHTGLRDNVPDFRKCCRTIKLDAFSRFIYWHMNFHTEHHMYAAVPCYNLKKLKLEIAWDMPEPRTLIQAWKEMREVRRQQKIDPGYQYDTPVPEHDSKEPQRDPLAASIGDLAPESL